MNTDETMICSAQWRFSFLSLLHLNGPIRGVVWEGR